MKRICLILLAAALSASGGLAAGQDAFAKGADETKPITKAGDVTVGLVKIVYPEGWNEIAEKFAKEYNDAIVKSADKIGFPKVIQVHISIRHLAPGAKISKRKPRYSSKSQTVSFALNLTSKPEYKDFLKEIGSDIFSVTNVRCQAELFNINKYFMKDYDALWFGFGYALFAGTQTLEVLYGDDYESPFTYSDAWLEAARDSIFSARPSCKGFRPEIQAAFYCFYTALLEKYGAEKISNILVELKKQKLLNKETITRSISKAIGDDCVKFAKEYKAKKKYASLGIQIDGKYKGIGVKIKIVSPDSSAAEGGLKVGDVISEINGDKINNLKDVRKIIIKANVGDTIKISVLRIGGGATLNVTLKERHFAIGYDLCSPPPDQKQPEPGEKDDTPKPE